MPTTSPTARTLQACRLLGWTAEVVEKWNPHSHTRKDLFGFADIAAVAPEYTTTWCVEPRLVLIQVTSSANLAARVAKILACQVVPQVLSSGAIVEAWGWKKYGNRWDARRVAIAMECGEPTQYVLPNWLELRNENK